MRRLLFGALLFFTAFAYGQDTNRTVLKSDSTALIAFYDATGGSTWNNTLAGNKPWKVGPVNPGGFLTWFGLTVKDKRVTELSMLVNDLKGQLPEELGSLGALVRLGLSNNASLNGVVPVSVGGLTNLTALTLTANDLEGPIDFINGLTNLEGLALSRNRFSGSIPVTIGDTQKGLFGLSLDDNNLSGELPEGLGNLGRLEVLELNDNDFSGEIPDSLGDLLNLRRLELHRNDLSGPLPPSFKNLAKLEILNLENNQVDGPIPPYIGQLSQLQSISLWNNKFSGPIPESMGDLEQLTFLWLGNNQLKGEIPESLTKLKNLKTFWLHDNQLEGPLPKDIGNLKLLANLNVNGNKLSGDLPESLGNLSELRNLTIAINAFTGPVPRSILNLKKLEIIHFEVNKLESLPDLSQLSALKWVWVERNRFTFRDLEPLADKDLNHFSYAPQDSVDTKVELDGEDVAVYISVGGKDTAYKWFRDDVEIEGATDSLYVLPDRNDTAFYRSEATHPDLPALTLYSRPIQVNEGLVLVVNSVADRPQRTDDDAEEDVCDTGETVVVSVGGVPLEVSECTLRAAIQVVNQSEAAGRPSIHFNLPEGVAPDIIPETQLNSVVRPVSIDGTTLSGGGPVRLKGSILGDDDEEDCGLALRAESSVVRGISFESYDGDSGLCLFDEGGILVENNFFDHSSTGIHASSPNNMIRKNRFLRVRFNSIVVRREEATENVIEENNFGSEGTLIHIWIREGASSNIVRNNQIASSNRGIEIGSRCDSCPLSEENIITGNEIVLSVWGIRVVNGRRNRIKRNVLGNNYESGIRVMADARETYIEHNWVGTDSLSTTLMPNLESGVYLYFGGQNHLVDNVIAGNGLNGIEIVRGEGNHIQNNTISDNKRSGVVVNNARSTLIEGNKIGVLPREHSFDGNGLNGIEVVQSTSTIIRDNTISGNMEDGIEMAQSSSTIANNRVGADELGTAPLGNGAFGISIDHASQSIIHNNVIAASGKSGLAVIGDGAVGTTITDNKIGTNIRGQDPTGSFGNGEHGIYLFGLPSVAMARNQIAFNSKTGVLLEDVGVGTITWNHLRFNDIGIGIYRGGASSIQSNVIEKNLSRGIDAEDVVRELLIENNTIKDQEGINTGIHLANTHAVLEGNQITDDAGDAITLEQGSTATLSNNNIFGNQGFGLNNRDASIMVEAQSNWWGDASGPAGNGPGSGDPVSDGVDFANWRTEMVAVVAATEQDTLFVPIAEADTVSAFLQNWQLRDDVLDLTLTDPQGWFQGATSFSISLSDSLGAEARLPFSIPGNAPEGMQNTIEVIATSQADPTHADTTSFTLIAQSTTLAQFFVVPDSIAVIPGDTVRFAALGFDQFSNEVAMAPVWNTTGGVIDAEGVYVAGNLGQYTVTATDPVSQLQAEALVSVLTSVDVEDEVETPLSFALEPNYPNPFNPRTTIQYTVAQPVHTRLVVYDMLGRQVAVLVNGVQEPGTHEVSFDARGLPSGVYVYRMTAGAFQESRTMLLVK